VLPPSLLRVGLFNTSYNSYFSIKLKNTHPRERFQRRGITFIVFFFSAGLGLLSPLNHPFMSHYIPSLLRIVAV